MATALAEVGTRWHIGGVPAATDSHPSPARAERLYHAYARTSRQGRMLLQRIRPRGWALLMISLLLLFLGANPEGSLTYQLFALIAGLLGAGTVAVARVGGSVVCVREAPDSAMVGSPVIIRYQIQNRGRRTLRNIHLAEMAPLAIPTLEEFRDNPEPNESRRNLFDRFFIFYRFAWLGERRFTFRSSESDPFDLAPGVSKSVSITVLPLRRGFLELRSLRLVRDDPLGLFRGIRPIEVEPRRVPVYPRPVGTIEDLRALGSARKAVDGVSPGHRAGHSEEFLGLREYKPGDALQHIHWKSFARLGQLIVREFEEVFRPRTALIVDTQLPLEGKAFDLTRAFEAAVAACATAAGQIQRGETLLELLLVQDRAHNFTAGPGNLQIRRILEVLAGIQPSTTASLRTLERLCIAHAPRCSGALFIGVQWDEARADLVRRLMARGVAVRALIIPPANAEIPDLPSHVRVASVDRFLPLLNPATEPS